MRKIILFMHSTFNGVVTGDPAKDKADIDWERPSTAAGREYLAKVMEPVDTLLFGRVTYEDFAENWAGMGTSFPLAEKINTAHKVVVTNTLKDLHWGEFEAPQRISGKDIEQQIADLKTTEGGDIMIFGSPTLVRALIDADLIDEYQIKIHPVVVPVGEHLFDGVKQQKDFKLLNVQAFDDNGMVVVYAPA